MSKWLPSSECSKVSLIVQNGVLLGFLLLGALAAKPVTSCPTFRGLSGLWSLQPSTSWLACLLPLWGRPQCPRTLSSEIFSAIFLFQEPTLFFLSILTLFKTHRLWPWTCPTLLWWFCTLSKSIWLQLFDNFCIFANIGAFYNYEQRDLRN